ncbi:hypothetical protein WJU23_08695 [Prosthecobacter sp. SYSU 5D2]|uniref:hypothetical protein n=1 Tax=Prosthecobacter sp. SYSU 5D2 TaxID=3134134 RepID=UPI0031FF170D
MMVSPPLFLDEPGLEPHDLSLFLRGGLLGAGQAPVTAIPAPTPEVALRNVPVSVLEGLAQVPVNEYLIDPQALVTELPAMDVERLLQFHASESRIRLYLFVLDRDQALDSTASLAPLIARLKGEGEVCLAIYPLGEPWRARFMVSPVISQFSSLAAMSEMADDCIKDAMQVQEAEQQLQRFAVRLSTRLFWSEKALPASLDQQDGQGVLHEVAAGSPLPVSVAEPVVSHWGLMASAGASVACVLLMTGLAFALRTALRYRADQKLMHAWILPETDVPPRLGGAFSGGAGSMIQFNNKIGSPRK